MKIFLGTIASFIIFVAIAVFVPGRASAREYQYIVFGCVPDEIAAHLVAIGRFTTQGIPGILCVEGYTPVYLELPAAALN